jgi:hypothetical protein
MLASLTWAALERLHDHFAATAIGIVNRGGEVAPQLFTVRANSQGRVVKMTVVPAQLMQVFMKNDAGKDQFADFLQNMLDERSDVHKAFVASTGYAPNLLVQVNEAWSLAPKDGEHFDAEGTVDGMRPSQHPNRQELVLVTLHARQGSVPVMHPIRNKPKRHAVKGRFPKESELPNFAGRFAMQEAFKVDSPSS